MRTQAEQILASPRWYLLAALWIFLYLVSVLQLADNTPKYDDLNDVFGFFKQLATAESLSQQVAAFFYPNNEHITLVNHLIYFAQYQLLGEVRFYPLILIGQGILVATGILLGSAVQGPRKPFYVACITLIYINIHSWDSTFKAMTALSNQAVIFFAFACLLALQKYRSPLAAAGLAMLASFSQGNGLLLWPLGLMLLLVDSHWRTHRYLYAMLWLLHAALAVVTHLWVRQHFGNAADTHSLFAQMQQNPALPLFATLTFMGASVFDNTQPVLATATGCGILMTLGIYTARSSNRQALLLYLAAFLFASALLVSVTRALGYGNVAAVIESRYKMYSLGLLAIALLLLADCARKPLMITAMLSALLLSAVGILLSSHRFAPAIQMQADVFRQSYQNWIEDGDLRRQAVYFPPMSDHFLFIAHYLQLLDFRSLTEKPWLDLNPDDTTCQQPASANLCDLSVSHRGNAIAVVIRTNLPESSRSEQQLVFCSENQPPRSVSLSATPAGTQAWLIAEDQLPPASYRVLLQTSGKASCETTLMKKPRKVQTEMQLLFNGPSKP